MRCGRCGVGVLVRGGPGGCVLLCWSWHWHWHCNWRCGSGGARASPQFFAVSACARSHGLRLLACCSPAPAAGAMMRRQLVRLALQAQQASASSAQASSSAGVSVPRRRWRGAAGVHGGAVHIGGRAAWHGCGCARACGNAHRARCLPACFVLCCACTCMGPPSAPAAPARALRMHAARVRAAPRLPPQHRCGHAPRRCLHPQRMHACHLMLLLAPLLGARAHGMRAHHAAPQALPSSQQLRQLSAPAAGDNPLTKIMPQVAALPRQVVTTALGLAGACAPCASCALPPTPPCAPAWRPARSGRRWQRMAAAMAVSCTQPLPPLACSCALLLPLLLAQAPW